MYHMARWFLWFVLLFLFVWLFLVSIIKMLYSCIVRICVYMKNNIEKWMFLIVLSVNGIWKNVYLTCCRQLSNKSRKYLLSRIVLLFALLSHLCYISINRSKDFNHVQDCLNISCDLKKESWHCFSEFSRT